MSDSAEDRRILLEALKRNFFLDELLTFVSVTLGMDHEEVQRDSKGRTYLEFILLIERTGRLREVVRELAVRDPDPALSALLARLPDEAGTLGAGEAIRAAPLTRLEAMPTDEVPPPSPTLPPGSRGLLPRNPHFTGRVDDLLHLARALKGGETVAIGQVAGVTGLGGIGKTQLANEFAHRYGQFFAGGVFWLSFAQGANVPFEVAACGEMMGLWPAGAELKVEEQVALVRRTWQEPTPRLLIFDNCEEEALLAEWRPPTGGCRVLLTSRRAEWSGTLAVQPLPLGVLKREESRALLAAFRPDLAAPDALDAIAKALGDLPLALHLAGSYLKNYRHDKRLGDPAHYLEQLTRPNLLDHASLQGKGAEWNPTGHEQHVARTFALSYEKLDADDPVDNLALALLHRAACLAPGEPIPRSLLVATLERPAREDYTEENEDALWRLLDLGLTEAAADGSLTFHRLLTLFAQKHHITPLLDTVERVVFVEAQRLNQSGHPASILSWQVHLSYLADESYDREDERSAALSNEMGNSLYIQGNFRGASRYYQRGLAIRERILGSDHVDTAKSLNNWGMLLNRLGDYVGARHHVERALKIQEQNSGTPPLDIATTLSNLGILLSREGEYASALKCFEQCLEIREKTYGLINYEAAKCLSHIAAIFSRQANYDDAYTYYRRASLIWGRLPATEHPIDRATHLNNWGWLLSKEGKYQEAATYITKALAIREQTLGDSHPDIARSLYDLGVLHLRKGDYSSAYSRLIQSLEMWTQIGGSDHPDTAQALDSLGVLLTKQGRYEEAEDCLGRALRIREQTWRPAHQDIAKSLMGLGNLREGQGTYLEAQRCYKRALAIYEAALGPNHPDTQTARANLAALAAKLGDEEAP